MHTISNKCEWNNCFIKNNQEILQDLSDFALQEQPEDNLMVSISVAWSNVACRTGVIFLRFSGERRQETPVL